METVGDGVNGQQSILDGPSVHPCTSTELGPITLELATEGILGKHRLPNSPGPQALLLEAWACPLGRCLGLGYISCSSSVPNPHRLKEGWLW